MYCTIVGQLLCKLSSINCVQFERSTGPPKSYFSNIACSASQIKESDTPEFSLTIKFCYKWNYILTTKLLPWIWMTKPQLHLSVVGNTFVIMSAQHVPQMYGLTLSTFHDRYIEAIRCLVQYRVKQHRPSANLQHFQTLLLVLCCALLNWTNSRLRSFAKNSASFLS